VFNYLKVVESNPDDAKTYWRLGNIHEARFIRESMAEEYLELMFEYFKESYEIAPDFAEANMGMGWSYFYKKDNDKANEFMKRAYELDPENSEINFLIGAFFRSIGLYEEALHYYSRALQLDPWPVEFVLSQEVLADCYSKLGRFEKAAEIVRNAIMDKPSSSLFLNYAWQLIMLGRYREAEIQLNRAVNLNPDSSSARLYRALNFAAQGNKERALELIQHDDDSFRYPVTSIFSQLGMKDEALTNIKLGIEVGFEKRGSYYYTYLILINNPCYEILRDDYRFQEILKAEKIKYEEKLRKYRDLHN
jgi:tetratricopeptide (TPR) repeat protein